jgi:hypothetical protein
MKTIIKQLEEKFGGKWEFHRIHFGSGIWVSEDLDATANYVACGGYDINGEYIPPNLPTMYIYGIGDPKRFIPKQSYKKWMKKLK